MASLTGTLTFNYNFTFEALLCQNVDRQSENSGSWGVGEGGLFRSKDSQNRALSVLKHHSSTHSNGS